MERKIQALNKQLESCTDEPERHRIQTELQTLTISRHGGRGQTQHKPQSDLHVVQETLDKIPSVQLDEGSNKFVLIRVRPTGSSREWHFVRANSGAKYHYMAAEPLIEELNTQAGLVSDEIEVLGR